jgi:hypothetical protein
MDNLENEEGISAGEGASVASEALAGTVVGDTPTGAILAVAGIGVTGSTGQQGAVDAIAGVAEPHPALAALDRLHEKLNTLGSFVVAETDALIAEIRNRLV